MLVGFADVPLISERIVDTGCVGDVLVISETIVDPGCDVVDGSADSVDELISTSTALDTFYSLPFVCAL